MLPLGSKPRARALRLVAVAVAAAAGASCRGEPCCNALRASPISSVTSKIVSLV
ncbi:hypothetical protein M440DRAFT_1405997 [Trichoderma longibrachiatum ATCC 18648]|uniref:Hydrophobin n=1 Tax=Trichoderma longibrachiatum ATCC 18648 TaxID=983965 RepID=A0A2T4BRR0_TRILO|nr:hypothetical protein M440DRAFT_1405997 [Trichoderma longibrachiatum ATCC 18648]